MEGDPFEGERLGNGRENTVAFLAEHKDRADAIAAKLLELPFHEIAETEIAPPADAPAEPAAESEAETEAA